MKDYLVEYSQRHGLPVLNSEEPLETVKLLIEQLESDEAQLSELEAFSLEVPKLRGFTVIPVYRIDGVKTEQTITAPQYNGHYVCEEYHGMTHPLLITPPQMVQPREDSKLV